MLDLGRHAEFIWLSYGAVTAVVVAIVVWLQIDGRRHLKRLAELESQGVRRRSARSDPSNQGQS